MRIEIKEMSRASTGDIIEVEGKVKVALKASEGQYGWSQFIIVKDDTGEQGAWINLEDESDKLSKGVLVKVKGKVGDEYKDGKGDIKRSLSGCAYELVGDKVETKVKGEAKGSKEEIPASVWEERDLRIARECAVKAVTELVCAKKMGSKAFFSFADTIVKYIYHGYTETGTKEKPKPEPEAEPEAKPEEEQRPATEAQKRVLFGYEGDDGIWKKGIVESRFITKKEVESIGEKDEVSFDTASYWIGYWWGEENETGERAKREMDAMPEEEEEPASMSGLVRDPLVKKNPDKKSSLKKDMLIDDINALRRENFLMDEAKFQNEFDVNGGLESLSEKKLGEIKKKFKTYHPKDWDK